MRRAAVVLLIVALSALLAAAQAPPTSIAWYANLARQRGQSTIVLNSTRENDAARPLKDLLQNSLIVDGSVISSRADATDGFQIFTWYRVRVLKHGPNADWKGVSHRGSVPPSVGIPNSGEVLVRMLGGAVTVDGVKVTQNSEPVLSVGKRYIFFLEPLSEGNGYVCAYQSTPVQVDDHGSILHSADTEFVRRLARFQSIDDLLSVTR